MIKFEGMFTLLKHSNEQKFRSLRIIVEGRALGRDWYQDSWIPDKSVLTDRNLTSEAKENKEVLAYIVFKISPALRSVSSFLAKQNRNTLLSVC